MYLYSIFDQICLVWIKSSFGVQFSCELDTGFALNFCTEFDSVGQSAISCNQEFQDFNVLDLPTKTIKPELKN